MPDVLEEQGTSKKKEMSLQQLASNGQKAVTVFRRIADMR